MDKKIFCKMHLNNYAEFYCEECNEIICSYCGLTNGFHINHINKIKIIEDIIKQKIKNVENIDNSSMNKNIELFQFIINFNSLYNQSNNNILSLINEQFDEYIGKIIELKIKIINLFSKEFEIISKTFQNTKKSVLDIQKKLLIKINENNHENKNQYLEKLNLCLEKIRLNENQNEVIKFLEEYQNLINECFENDDDLNKKYNLYLSYKYINDISLHFKDNFFNKLIEPYFKKSLNQLEDIFNNINEEEKKEYEKIKSKLNQLNTEIINKKEDNKKIAEKKTIKNEIKENNNITNIKDKKQNNNIMEKIKMLEENRMKSKEDNIKKENVKEGKINEKKENKIENVSNIKEENIKVKKEDQKEIINNKNIIVEKEKKEIKRKLENKIIFQNNEKNINLNKEFDPPKIEGGKMTEEELKNIKEDEEDHFLRKASDLEEKNFISNLENTEVEIVEKILNDLDEDRLDIQYYEGVKFPKDEIGELNDNAYLEDEEKKDKINVKEEEKEKEDEEKNKINNVQEKKEEKKEKKEENKNDNKKNNDLNALFGVNINKKEKNNQQNENKEAENIKKNPSLNLDTWVNIDSIPIEGNKNSEKDKNTDKKSKRKTTTKNPSNFKNLFGVNINEVSKKKEKKDKKKEEEQIEKKGIKELENQKENKKEIIYEEPKIPAPKNKESLEKFKQIYDILSKEGKKDKKFFDLFNSLTWEEKNYIEIIGLKQSDSKVFVYNQILNKIEDFEVDIKFPSLQSYVNVPPYVYFSGGKIDNKPIKLIRRLRKLNNQFKIEEMGGLKEARSHHTTIYIKSLNSLIFISGSKTKTCEKLNLLNNTIENFPSINVGREKCGACLTNNEDLYIFFGFDKSKQKFESTIEKINIINQKSWSVLPVNGDHNLLKRYSMACIPLNFTNKQGIMVIGGVGNLRNDLEDSIFIELDTNNVKKFIFLPFGSSFTNPNFLPLTLGTHTRYIYNISNENEIVCFNLESCKFKGIE